GASLNAYIKRLAQKNQVIQLSETLLLLAQVADALGYAHRQGVVHRDVKPDNILLKPLPQPEREGELPLRAVVTDFGLAKLLEGGVQTQTGTFMGTLPYMSPEQCLGKELDGRSDLYSLGIMLYQLATGQMPFQIKSPTEAVLKHVNEAPTPPRAVRPGVPALVEAVITRLLAKDPAARFITGEELAKALRQAAGGLTEADVTKFSPPESVVSLVTQLVPESLKAAEPSRLGFDLTALPGQDRLLIARQGEAPRSITLEKDQYTIGRSADNDIALPGEGVSRRHARLERTPERGWQVRDMGSTNGTYLEQNKLLSDIPENWASDQALRIGSYFLRWQATGVIGGAAPGATAVAGTYPATVPPGGAPVGATQVQSTSGQISLLVNPANLEVSPGGRANVQVELLNQGLIVDHFRLRVEGLPVAWVTIAQDTVQLLPGARSSLPVTIHPPQESAARAGQHPFKLVVSAASNQQEAATAKGVITVKPFERFTVDARPTTLRHEGIVRVLVQNEGNADGNYVIVVRDPAEAIRVEGQRSRLALAAGAKGTVDLALAAKKRPWLGATQQLPFEIQVSAASDARQVKVGQMQVRPRLPGWLLPLLGLLLVLLCVAGGALLSFFNQRNEQATATFQAQATAIAAVTQTAGALQIAVAEQTRVAEQATAVEATAIAQTAIAQGDDDQDGLSNSAELTAGTDPNNPDHDSDGLSDGVEVNQFSTNPRKQDTDDDTLLDGEEVNTHGTSPTNPDTDSDGVPDGVEIAGGTDPKSATVPTETPTPTSPATDTPTTTLVPTETPTPTNQPTNTPTPTPPPTDTPTPTPTPVPALPYSQFFLDVPQTWDADLDLGYIGAGDEAEFWFHAVSADERYVEPQNGALLARVEVEEMRAEVCASTPLSGDPIPVIELSTSSQVCYLTNQGRYGYFQLLAPVGPSPGTLNLSFTTWAAGVLDVPQTWLVDLDTGVIGVGPDSDIWFQAETADERFVAAENGASIALMGTESPGYEGCLVASFTTGRIHVNDLPAGTYVCYFTNLGHYGQFVVNADVGPSPGTLSITFFTWQ
ncbi:MAG: protein kinase, partial [Chloroflexota bacterium]